MLQSFEHLCHFFGGHIREMICSALIVTMHMVLQSDLLGNQRPSFKMRNIRSLLSLIMLMQKRMKVINCITITCVCSA